MAVLQYISTTKSTPLTSLETARVRAMLEAKLAIFNPTFHIIVEKRRSMCETNDDPEAEVPEASQE